MINQLLKWLQIKYTSNYHIKIWQTQISADNNGFFKTVIKFRDVSAACGQQRWVMSSCVVKSRGRNPYTAVQVDPDSDYITPGTLDLEQLFWTGPAAQYAHVNQVWPSLFIGDEWVNTHRDWVQVIQFMMAALLCVYALQENSSGAAWPQGSGYYTCS